MFLNDVSLRLCWSTRCCYPSCLLPLFPVHRSRLPVHELMTINGVICRSEAFIVMSGTKGHNHTVRPLAPPYSAVYGVWLASSRGVPVVSRRCGGGSRPGCSRLPVWGSGVLPTVGRGIWWVLPHYWGAPTTGRGTGWGRPYSGARWIVGASPLLGLPDCGCARIVGAYLQIGRAHV